jgi:hypothetical protein
MPEQKIVVFDLDETLGYFTELSYFIHAVEKVLQQPITQDEFNHILDIFQEFLRPNIFKILTYLKHKKMKSKKIQVMIYTNNQGPKTWTVQIKNYFEKKIHYPLFDQIIAAFKVNGTRLEMCRTTHKKTVSDFLNCTHLPIGTKICFLDDRYHEQMDGEDVFYINVKPYTFSMRFNEMAERYYLINKDKIKMTKTIFVENLSTEMKKYNYNVFEKSLDEQHIDEIVGKQIMIHLVDFFKKYDKRDFTKRIKAKRLNKTKKFH